MKYEEIEKFLTKKEIGTSPVRISFKTRSAITGLFIKSADYGELSRKNLWRIVSEAKISSYVDSRNESLARIFNGAEITRLELINS